MENWDLQAVVRGCNTNIDEAVAVMENSSQVPYSFINAPFSNIEEEDDFFHANFSHLFEPTTALDELEGLCKPFYPLLRPTSPPTTLVTSSISFPQEVIIESPKKHIKTMKQSPTASKKSRKNQNKRVVKEVKAEDLFSDVWGWRKYGQKPIKGSPYPRSYYRCSSSKGCSARKQVERSCSNPETFVVTYTAEHNHDHPTRRNSLAGSTRSKFPSYKNKDKCVNNSLNFPAMPNLAATPSQDDRRQFVQSGSNNETGVKEEEDENGMLGMMLSTDEVSPCFEDLDIGIEPVMDDFFFDQFPDNVPSPWFNSGCSYTVTEAC